jgi:hypothetical protein
MSSSSIMARKNEIPQKAAMREIMSSYLKENDICIKNGADVNAVMRDMVSVILEDALDIQSTITGTRTLTTAATGIL